MYLRSEGAEVVASEDPDRATYRAGLGVPDAAASCHTAVVDGYAIEGHVPVEAIAALLKSLPEAVGLALPAMPGDSPGMGGDQSAWMGQPVLLIGPNSDLSDFTF